MTRWNSIRIEAGSAGWLPAQEHHGENVGETPTHVLFVELKEAAESAGAARSTDLGPSTR